MRSHVARERTRFIGRVEELSRARAALTGGAALVTLHGPPGAGKSRLARRLAREFDVRFVDLSDARDVGALIARISGVASADLERGVAALVDAVAGETMLVLDPFEHLVETGTPVLGALLDAVPELSLLLGSRERTRLDGEITIVVGALSLEDAVELFVDRARAVAPTRTFSRTDIVDLVERVDRLPLAIELLAARSPVLSPREQLAQLPSNLLRSAVDASLALLDRGLSSLWATLGVFRGGFTLAAAEAVASARAEDLEKLAAHALIEVRDTDRGTRYELFATLREQAERRIGDDARARHARYFAENPSPLERENMLAAFDHTSDASSLVRLAVALDPLLVTAGPFELHRRVLDRALAVSHNAPPQDHAALLRAHARFLGLRGRHGEGYEILARARELYRVAGDAHGEAWCDSMIAFHARALGLPHEALAAGERARDGGVRFRDRVLTGLGEQMIAFAEYSLGRRDEAYQRTRRAAAIARAAEAPRMLGIALANASYFAYALGRRDEARACYEECRAAVERAGDRVHALKVAPMGALLADDLDEAEAKLEVAIAGLQALGDAQTEAHARLDLALIGLRRGDLRFAERALDDAREAVSRADDVELRIRAEIVAARVARARGEPASIEGVVAECEQRGLVSLAEEARELGPAVRSSARALTVARDAHAFSIGGRRVELGRRGAAKRILLALVERRRAAPGEGLTVHSLFAVGWPGERAIGTSGHARVYMAIRALRGLGLEGALVTRDDGYLLDPHLEVALANDI